MEKNILEKNIIEVEKVNMLTPLKKYAKFTGRSRRKEFWLWILFLGICGFIFRIIIENADTMNSINGLLLLNFVWACFIFIPDLAVRVRRLHDTGRSAWNLCWIFLPIIGAIILLVFFCKDSQKGSNKYGPNPKGE